MGLLHSSPGRGLRLLYACLLCCLTGPSAARAGSFCDGFLATVLEQSATRTVVRLDWPEDALPGSQRLSVAVPGPAGATPRILTSEDLPVDPRLLEGRAVAEAPVAVSPPYRFRSQWVVGIRVDPVVDPANPRRFRSLTLQLDHPTRERIPAVSTPASDDHLYEGWLLNPQAARGFRELELSRAKANPPVVDIFAASPNWVRVEVVESGLHAVSYDDLALVLGTAVDLVDPASLRVFGARAEQPLLAEDKDGSWKRDYGLLERAIVVEADGPALEPGDRLIWWAMGPEGWRDLYEPGADPEAHFEHPYAERLAYWVTWDRVGGPAGDFGAPPQRVATLDVSATGSGLPTTSFRARIHQERNLVQAYGVTPDNWAWLQTLTPGVPVDFSFPVEDPVPGATAGFLTWCFGRPVSGQQKVDPVLVASFNGGPILGQRQWRISDQESPLDDPPLEFRINNVPIVDGTNTLRVTNASPANNLGQRPEIWFEAFSLTYPRQLVATDGTLLWSLWEDEQPSPGIREFRVTDDAGPWTSAPYVFEITDPARPVRWVGSTLSGAELRAEVEVPADTRRHFLVTRGDRLRSPDRVRLHRPRLIRHEVGEDGGDIGWDMVILAPTEFMGPAADLAAFRSQQMAGRESPRATAVDLQDVYDQFGHGVKEPAAIRNYLKFLYEVDPRLEFVVLFGDASRDYRNVADRDPSGAEIDRCPTFIETQYPFRATQSTRKPYAADDWFGALDNPPDPIGFSRFIDLPDLAVGRLPVGNLSEANRVVQRILDYEQSPPSGRWRNRTLLVADDEVGLSGPNYAERAHVEEAECVAERLLPSEMAVDKLYLTDFPVVPGTRAKPSARQAMRDRWSEGSLIIHYIGHGSPEQLADEAVFRIEDVPGLTNADRRPLFLAFSCDVAIFDSHVTKSMSEQLLLTDAGGAIATIAATQVTFIGPNEELTEAFYPQLYPGDTYGRSRPVGTALMLAKANVPQINREFVQHNDQKYCLLGDPAMQLRSPEPSVALGGQLADAILSGRRLQVTGTLPPEAGAASGNYFLDAKEAADSTAFLIEFTGGFLEYRNDGNSFFTGGGTYTDGTADVELVTPSFMEFGPEGRVELLMESGSEAYLGVVEPEVRRVAINSDDTEGPRILMSFTGNARTVTPGTRLTATLEDPNGINVLGTVPANSLQLEFDESGIPVDVTSLFRLEDGSFDRGTLQYVLPDEILPGEHTATLTASDMLNNISRVTLSFDVQAAGGIAIANHAVFPNPFTREARFVVELTAPPTVGTELTITIFTTSGRPVRRLRATADGSTRQVIAWDGRDDRGDEIANGVYLYTLRGTFGLEPTVELTETGRVVRMR